MKRLITGLILTPFFFYTVVFSPDWFYLLALTSIALICYYEYLGIAGAHLPQINSNLRRSPAGYAAGLLLLFLPGGEALFLTLAALLIWILLLRSGEVRVILPSAAAQVFGVLYVFGCWRVAIPLRGIDPWWMLFATALNWAGDTFAYYFGSAFGRHKLAPSISPGKSWEGTLASLLGTAIIGVLFLHWKFPQVALPQAVLLCLAANIAGQVGDLCESAIKRGAGIKDSGDLLPGHGGWLDRVDSSLFALPVVYWLLQQKWILP